MSVKAALIRELAIEAATQLADHVRLHPDVETVYITDHDGYAELVTKQLTKILGYFPPHLHIETTTTLQNQSPLQ